jgi:hypothetical protein
VDWRPWFLAAAFVLLLLAAAKAHGRQVRLEREARGILAVDFRRDNDPWVEALWRRDRRVFWTAFPVLLLLALALAALLRPDWPVLLLLAAGAFAASFVVAGLASLARLVRGGAGEAAWRRAALRGSALWWVAVGALGGVVAALAKA